MHSVGDLVAALVTYAPGRALECGGSTPLWMDTALATTSSHPKRCRATALQETKIPQKARSLMRADCCRWLGTALAVGCGVMIGMVVARSRPANLASAAP